jgi:predicted Ser/Thr protein kinase
VTTSSIAAPDLEAICRSALGRSVVAAQPIGAGRNSRVFRVDLDAAAAPATVVVKCYRRDPGDPRDRLRTEFEGLQFLWQNGVRAVPRPIAVDGDRQCGIYEYIAGEVVTPQAIAPGDVDVSVEFLAGLRQLGHAPGAAALPPASEACFSLADIVAGIDRRLDRLRGVPAAGSGAADVARAHQWLDRTFVPVLDEAGRWCRETAARSGIDFDQPIDPDSRTLSPSDFGFHNSIRRADGTLAFVDFEYFGWDDPAKTIVDYLLHPGMAMPAQLKRRFAERAHAAFAGVPLLAARAAIVYPLFGLKWALILLNDFLPDRLAASNGAGRLTQLEKARGLADRVAGEYTRNPYLT